jgi:hypothetical protein
MWAELDSHIQECLRQGHENKVLFLLKKQCIEMFGTTPRRNAYSEIVLAKLKMKEEKPINTKWGEL